MEEKNRLYPTNQQDKSDFIVMESYPGSGEAEVDHFTDKIPVEIAFLIFSFLDLKSLCFSSLVSKHWNQLANDSALWKGLLKQYSEGYLWRHLFRNPEAKAYEEYFLEVFDKKNVSIDNLFNEIGLKEKLLKQIIVRCVSERKAMFDKYFEQIDYSSINITLDNLVKSVRAFSNEIKSQFHQSDFEDIIKNQNHIKLIALLHQIKSVETLLVNQFYLHEFACFSILTDVKKLISVNTAAFLKTSTIMVLMASVGEFTLLREPSSCQMLLNRLNGQKLVECATCSHEMAELILRQPDLINRLTDENLLTIFCNISDHKVGSIFFGLLQDNPQFLKRCSADFLLKLVEYKGEGQFEFIPNLILSHPILIQCLNEDQCVKILEERTRKLLKNQNIETLSSEGFKSYTLNLDKPRHFLLRMSPHLEEMYAFDWVAELLTAEDALRAKDDLAIGMEIAKLDIFIKKFNRTQLLELTNEHPCITLIVLKKEYLVPTWTHEELECIKMEAGGSSNSTEMINTAIMEIRIKQNKYRQELINQRQIALKKEENNKSCEHYQLPQSSYAKAALQLNIQPELEKREPPREVLHLKKIDNMNRQHAPILRKHSRQSSDSVTWSIISLMGLGLLLTLGILLCATGVGAAAGVPFLVSTIALLPLSLEAVVIPCLIIGVFMSLTGSNLMLEHSTKLLRPIISSIKGLFIKSSSEHSLPYFSIPHRRPNAIFEPLPRLSLTLESSKITQLVSNEANHSPRFN
jgi:hypothetical protein